MSAEDQRQPNVKAPRSRVWQALTDAEQFGAWFLAELEGQFALGKRITGTMTHPECSGVGFEAEVERMAIAQGFGVESTTLVEFAQWDAALERLKVFVEE